MWRFLLQNIMLCGRMKRKKTLDERAEIKMLCKKIQLDDSAYLKTYVADKTENYTRKGVLVIPGGAYCMVSDREAEPVALGFLPQGFNAFVLHYSVEGEKTFPAQLIQASKAMKHIKDHAEEYGIDPDRVFVVGFSAGGHLAASLATMWNKQEIYEEVEMPFGYNKPRGAMLIYPVITGDPAYSHQGSFRYLFDNETPDKEQLAKASIEQHVTENACPAYLIHAANDPSVPVENSLLLAMAYSKEKIPFEMHIYPRGKHGFSLGNPITAMGNEEPNHNEQWLKDAAAWCEKVLSGEYEKQETEQ